MTPARLRAAYETARGALLAERTPAGHWVGELSSSALATAVACFALRRVDAQRHAELIRRGVDWLKRTQNPDGGWGDTTKSFSNVSTSMLVAATFAECGESKDAKLEAYLDAKCGTTPAARAEAIRARYGKDRTFSVPILMTSALAGLVPWGEVPRLPFELACLPQSWYRFVGLPVVSYALPALIAIGQCIHHHRGGYSPFRPFAKSLSLKVLRRIQPSSGGYLEATPLTAFVVTALSAIGRKDHPVVADGVRFLVDSARPDGSWPIDTDLSIWLTTLSINALSGAGDLDSLDRKPELLDWLLKQQSAERHPFTGAAPGAWGWSDKPGSVPDCDDTPGAILAVEALGGPVDALKRGRRWTLELQNRDGGFPTFCRGWGKLPFDRSGCDLTAHTLRAVLLPLPRFGGEGERSALQGSRPLTLTLSPEAGERGLVPGASPAIGSALAYLARQQRPDGSWLPLWFGNQHAPDDENPVYGTARVLAAYRDLGLAKEAECQRGVSYILSVQNADGGWGGAAGCPSSVEETAVAVEVLLDLAPPVAHAPGSPVGHGLQWLVGAVESGRFREPSPIGFYFAKLWYFEKLYPLIFTVAALGRAVRVTSPASV